MDHEKLDVYQIELQFRSGKTKFDMRSRTTTRTRTRTMAAKARRSERYGLARVKGIPSSR